MPQSEANPKVFSGRKRKKGDIAEISEAKRSWGNPDGHISMDTAEMETLKKRCSQQADYVKHLHGQIEKKDKEARHWLQRFTKACEENGSLRKKANETTIEAICRDPLSQDPDGLQEECKRLRDENRQLREMHEATSAELAQTKSLHRKNSTMTDYNTQSIMSRPQKDVQDRDIALNRLEAEAKVSKRTRAELFESNEKYKEEVEYLQSQLQKTQAILYEERDSRERAQRSIETIIAGLESTKQGLATRGTGSGQQSIEFG